MQKGMLKKVSGFVLVLIGIVLVSFTPSLTGAVIGVGKTLGEDVNIVLGLILVLAGLFMLITEREERESGVEKKVKIVITKNFEDAIKRHDLKRINAAIAKIGTELGKEHLLSNDEYAINTSKGGRIVYSYNDDHTIATLKGYTTPSHDYQKALRGRR